MVHIKNDNIVYRQAIKKDCPQMAKLINHFATKGLMLPKNKTQLMVVLSNYLVAEYEQNVIATVGFKIWDDSQVEIISLATDSKFQKIGIGSIMIGYCVEKASSLGFKDFFTLTVSPKLFSRFGFRTIDHKNLQQKIWTDCIKCPRNAGGPGDPRCNETALTLSL